MRPKYNVYVLYTFNRIKVNEIEVSIRNLGLANKKWQKIFFLFTKKVLIRSFPSSFTKVCNRSTHIFLSSFF